jgi:SulP family sulfate permease
VSGSERRTRCRLSHLRRQAVERGAGWAAGMCADGGRSSKSHFVRLKEDADEDTAAAGAPLPSRATTPPLEASALWKEESGGLLSELMGGLLSTMLVLVLNVTYAGVIMGGNIAYQPFVAHGISMCLACTAISNTWLIFARRNLPFITVADSFMAVLFATTADRIVAAGGGEADLGTLAAAMCFSAVFLGVGYVAVGFLQVCNVVQFVPTPVMAGYQASIGYLLLDSASTLASGCSLLNPECLTPLDATRMRAIVQLLIATGLGVSLHVATQRAEGVMRTMMMPSLFLLITVLFQLLKAFAAPGTLDLSDW